MADFIKTKLGTKPTPIKLTVSPTVVGSTQIQLKLGELPSMTITSTPEGSGWEKFNANVSEHMIKVVGDALLGFARPVLQSEAQQYLNEHAAFDVPTIPINVEGIEATLTPADLKISTNGNDYVMVTASVTVT